MAKLFALALVFPLMGCAGTTSFEVALGYGLTDGGFAGPDDTVRFTLRRDHGRTFCALTHISHITAGKPFNDRHEDWLDIVECGLRFGVRR